MLVRRRGSDGWKERKGARASWMIFWSSLFSRSSWSWLLVIVVVGGRAGVFSVSCCSVCHSHEWPRRILQKRRYNLWDSAENVRWINEMSVKSIVHKGDAVQERTVIHKIFYKPASRKMNPPEGFYSAIKICFCTLSGLLHGYLADNKYMDMKYWFKILSNLWAKRPQNRLL